MINIGTRIYLYLNSYLRIKQLMFLIKGIQIGSGKSCIDSYAAPVKVLQALGCNVFNFRLL